MASSKKIGRNVEESVDKALANISASTPKPDMKGGDTELKSAVAPKKAETFAEAFRAARKDKGAGKTFTWGGKSYTTNYASEGPKRSGTAPAKPAAKASAATAAKPAATAAKPPVGSRANPFPANKKEDIVVTGKSTPAKPADKTRTSKDRSAEARKRMGAALSAINPFRAVARGIDSALTAGTGTSKPAATAKPDAAKSVRLANLKRAAEAPGASRFAKDRYNAAKETGMYRKGGKIDGIAIRGKTRAPLKKGK